MTQSSESPASRDAGSTESGQLDDAEAQMRRALGLDGSLPRPRPEPERSEPAHRPTERFGFGGHRRRFVQDGEVPVTVVRREPGSDPGPARQPLAAPTTSRLQRVEMQLAAEIAARTQVERALSDAQTQIRDLQTKLGHAELAKNEALEAARRDRETIAAFRGEAGQHAERLREAEERAQRVDQALAELQDSLEAERDARKDAERTLRHAEEARDVAEHLVRELSEAPLPALLAPEKATRKNEGVAPGRRGRVAAHPAVEAEPEPVKWWLTPANRSTRPRR